MAVKPVPEGYHTITPYLVVGGAGECIEFLKKAFGAEETFRMPMPGGKVGHAELRLGDSILMIADAGEQAPARKGGIHLYVPDVDAVYKRAVDAGATGLGVSLGLSWTAALAGAFTWLVLYKLLRISSVGSLAGALATLAVAACVASVPVVAGLAVVAAIILVRHQGNLRRLLRREEHRVP